MSSSCISDVAISGVSCAVPTHIDKLAQFDGDKDKIERFVKTTGISERRLAHSLQTCSDLCKVAAEKLIVHKKYERNSFDGLIFVSQSADYHQPATAHVLQHRLGFSVDCACLDISLGCSGFNYGVSVAASMIHAGIFKRVLLCCGETHLSAVQEKWDYSSGSLFGHAGTAIIIEKGNGRIRTLLKSFGDDYSAIIMPGVAERIKVNVQNPNVKQIGPHMDGDAVFEFSITRVPEAFKQFFELYGGCIDDYDHCVFHQANLFILKHICKKIKLNPEKMPISIDRYGNTSSASIPLTISDLIKKGIKKDRLNLITCGFGIGLSLGVTDFEIESKDILPIVETDDYFKEAYLGE